jgi:hypothetical protein
MRKLFVDSRLGMDKLQIAYVADFINYCCEKLGLTCDMEIHLCGDREESGIGTTGVYMVGDHVVKVYCKNRALPDVMRSVAHELTHMMQDEAGLIKGQIKDAGGFHEDQANARAGEYLKTYARDRKDKAFYDI